MKKVKCPHILLLFSDKSGLILIIYKQVFCLNLKKGSGSLTLRRVWQHTDVKAEKCRQKLSHTAHGCKISLKI